MITAAAVSAPHKYRFTIAPALGLYTQDGFPSMPLVFQFRLPTVRCWQGLHPLMGTLKVEDLIPSLLERIGL
jgi:hypothetical protein